MYPSLEPEVIPVRVSRKLILAFAAIFVVGLLAGFVLAQNFADTKVSVFLKNAADPDAMATHIDQNNVKFYQLSADQMAAIKPLTRAYTQKIYEARNQFASAVVAAMDDYHSKVAAQMTPAQRDAYAKANEDRKKRLSALLFLNQGSPAPAQQ